jgi:hypothetical protein
MNPEFGPQDDMPGEGGEEDLPPPDQNPENQEGGGDESGGGMNGSPPVPGAEDLPDDADNLPRI